MPRESDGGFDPKGEVRGYGPFLLEDYKPSALHVWRRNPDYYMKGRPFYDKVENPIVSEYATRLAQFRAGNIWLTQATQDDVIQTKKDVPALLLRQGESFATTPSFIGYGYEGNSPFKDQRVRQAAAMMIDVDLMADVISNRPKFEADGLDVPIRYHTMVGAGWEGYWVDPLDDKKFGPNAKFLKFDLAEAKKLLTAAGFANGFETDLYFNGGTQYGAAYTRVAEVLAGMWAEGGINVKRQPKDYQTDWLPNYYYSYATPANPGKTPPGYNGLSWNAERGYPTVASQLFATMHKDGARFHGMSLDGKSPHLGDAQANTLIEKIRSEFDLQKQQDLVGEFIRYVTGKTYQRPFPYDALGYGTYWPCVANLGLLRTYAGGNVVTETYGASVWLDTTKPPFKAS